MNREILSRNCIENVLQNWLKFVRHLLQREKLGIPFCYCHYLPACSAWQIKAEEFAQHPFHPVAGYGIADLARYSDAKAHFLFCHKTGANAKMPAVQAFASGIASLVFRCS